MSDAQTHAAKGTYMPTIAHQRHLDVVLGKIAAERGRQDQKWGGPDHDDEHRWFDWLNFIREHTEKARTVTDPMRYRQRLVEVAALAAAAIQALDRQEGI